MRYLGLKEEPAKCYGIKISVEDKEKNEAIGKIFLFVLYDDSGSRPFGRIEWLFVSPEHRSGGLDEFLVEQAIQKAEVLACRHIIADSRHSNIAAYNLYLKTGFKDYGKKFRLDLV